MKIYGHYASQPARSVLWLLKMHQTKVPFEFIKVEPLAGGTKKPDFLSKFPTAMVPALEDNGVFIAECSAIMQYICEKHQLDQYWSMQSKHLNERAKVNEYLSHHHTHLRKVSPLVAFHVFKEKFFKKKWDLKDKDEAVKNGHLILKEFETIFLKPKISNGIVSPTWSFVSTSPQPKPQMYVNGFTHPTIADLIAYTEVAQLEQLKVMKFEASEYPYLTPWLEQMRQLPEHDDCHQTVVKIGSM
jgi:glutathione S-transferase